MKYCSRCAKLISGFYIERNNLPFHANCHGAMVAEKILKPIVQLPPGEVVWSGANVFTPRKGHRLLLEEYGNH